MDNKYFTSIKPIGKWCKDNKKNKRGMGLGDLYPAILIIALVAILIAIVLFVLDEFQDQMGNATTGMTAAYNATGEIITDIGDFVPWIGVILLIIAAAIVLGILVKNLAGGARV